MRFRQQAICFTLLIFPLILSNPAVAADRFYISIPGPTLSYTHLYYGQEKGFFAQEQLDLQVLVVRGVIGVSSLMSGEIDVTCHAGSGLAAALRGLPIKVISVTHDRPVHELIVAPSIASPAELKGKAVAFALGKSHPIEFKIPEGIQIAVDKQTHIVVSGADKGQVGQVAADIRSLRPPDPYKQKGIRITGERLKKKAGKAGAKAGGAA